MRSFVSSLFMAWALALASGPAVLGQNDNISNRYGSIEGHLMPASGENDLPRMVTVRLIGQGFQKVTFATGGRFYFNEVPAGNYMLVASSEGRKDAVINLAGWAPHSSDPMISLVLGPRLREELPPGDPVVSVETLRIPEKAQREFHKGLEFLQKDELQKAEKHLLKALEIYPEYFQAYNNLGVLSMGAKPPIHLIAPGTHPTRSAGKRCACGSVKSSCACGADGAGRSAMSAARAPWTEPQTKAFCAGVRGREAADTPDCSGHPSDALRWKAQLRLRLCQKPLRLRR
jgi:tetratricopeptide (TPR) repeat protein